MSIIPQITCKNCGEKYSGIKTKCPVCHASRKEESARSAATTDSVRPGTNANAGAVINTKMQFIFGIILLVAVIVAVIILICVSTNGGASKEPEPTAVVETTPVPTRTPIPTPTPTPTPTVTSISVTFLGKSIEEFSMSIGDAPIQLVATPYPVDTEAKVTWTAKADGDHDVVEVDETGAVSAVGSGWATVTAKCGAVSTDVRVLVW